MEGLGELLDILTRVKKKGWDNAFPENLYNNHSDITRPPVYSGQFLTCLKAIKEATLCIKALNVAQSRLGKRLRSLRKLSRPLVLEDGIKRLPDEILAIIFEMTRHVNGSQPYPFAVCLSHVSRRFRRIALATPSLWTTIHDTYDDSQIQVFISRSGRLDLDIKIRSGWGMESFLEVLKGTTHRWSSFDLIDDDTEYLLEDLGMMDLPRLRFLSYAYPVELSKYSIPMLSQLSVQGIGRAIPAGSWFLSKLTHLEFHLSKRDENLEDLTATLQCMKNVRDLSFKLRDCTLGNVLPADKATYPKPHSVHIDRLAISIEGEMQDYSGLLFDALSHLWPSTLELSIYSNLPDSCDVVKTVHFDAPMGKGPSWCLLDNVHWERIRSLDNLRFTNCDGFTESEVETLTTKLLPTEAENAMRSLEIISCKLISEDFLLGLHDEVGDRLKWTL
ncbi:hypothetical protein BD410DRAFT_804406 [Rickenella mellea]|uniref:F-box domain-containing protein n=1 Tax=Rickenella mellea TaxID=50990 RepID=A0A4Y7Q0P7_9AGAM|nr:hypothetical protein BD410DRAFT_804406 [Rickenella mellea]